MLGLAARVREVCLEKLATFGGPDAVRTNLPVVPTLDEPLAANLPPPPSESSELGRWAAQIAELAETRARDYGEAQRGEGLREGEAKGLREGEARGKAAGLREGEAKGLREGEAKGLREGEAKGLRAAVLDACELLGLELGPPERAQLDAMGVSELEALRRQIKQTRRWPKAAP